MQVLGLRTGADALREARSRVTFVLELDSKPKILLNEIQSIEIYYMNIFVKLDTLRLLRTP